MSDQNHYDFVVIGAGISGLAFSERISKQGRTCLVLEKSESTGGHAKSHIFEDCIFDEGPHISFTKNLEVQDKIWQATESESFTPVILNYWNGYWLPHPVQTNTYGLPVRVRIRILLSFISRKDRGLKDCRNYQDWCNSKFGKYFTREFAEKYTRKYWRLRAQEMSINWVDARIHTPTFWEILCGMKKSLKKFSNVEQHYISTFRYPKQGGFQSFFNTLGKEAKIKYGAKVIKIDTENKVLFLECGDRIYFKNLISSMPLDELIRIVDGLEFDSGDELLCTSVVLVNSIYSTPPLVDAHWTYIYDEGYFSTRISFPFKLAHLNAPNERFTVQTEIYHENAESLTDDEIGEIIGSELKNLGIFNSEPMATQVLRLSHANVVFNIGREKTLTRVTETLEKKGISLIGRYGKWDYSWSDEAILSGWSLARKFEGIGES
jgi:protoporphyrinogen oxidase